MAPQRFCCPCSLGQLFLVPAQRAWGTSHAKWTPAGDQAVITSAACHLVQPPPRVEPGAAPPPTPTAAQVAHAAGPGDSQRSWTLLTLQPSSRRELSEPPPWVSACAGGGGVSAEQDHVCPGSGEARGAPGATQSWCSARVPWLCAGCRPWSPLSSGWLAKALGAREGEAPRASAHGGKGRIGDGKAQEVVGRPMALSR